MMIGCTNVELVDAISSDLSVASFAVVGKVKSPDLLLFGWLCQSLEAASGFDILHCSASVVPQVALSSDVMFAFLGTDVDRRYQC